MLSESHLQSNIRRPAKAQLSRNLVNCFTVQQHALVHRSRLQLKKAAVCEDSVCAQDGKKGIKTLTGLFFILKYF